MGKNHNPCLFIITVLLLELVSNCCGDNVKKSIDNVRSDMGGDDGDNEDSKDVAMEIPEIEPAENRTVQLCSARRQGHQMHAILNAANKQFPFMVSLMSLSEEHLCSGSLVSNGMFLTTASCVKKQISSVLLNTVKAKKDTKDAVLINVIKTEVFPSYTGEESLNNVGIVYTHRHNASVGTKVRISNYTSAQNLGAFEVLGYGLNAEVGTPKNLQYVGLENRYHIEVGNALSAYIDCVESKEPTCLKDIGGPAIFGNELIGIVTQGQEECTKEMSAEYAINKLMATILPSYSFKAWLDEKIKKNEEQSQVTLATYPSKLVAIVKKKPILRKSNRISYSNGIKLQVPWVCIVLTCAFVLYFY